MRSKWFKYFLISSFLIFSIFATGCSYFLDGKEKNETVSFAKNDASCLGGSSSILSEYMSDLSNNSVIDAKLVALKGCYTESVDAFVQYTKSGEEKSGHYRPEHLEQFLEKFYPDFQVDPETLRGLFEIKTFLMGGSEKFLTKKEIKVLSNFIDSLLYTMREIAPHRELLFGQARLERNQENLDQYQKTFRIFKKSVGEVLYSLKGSAGNREIDLARLGAFVMKIMSSDKSEEEQKVFMGLLISFKNLVLNQDGSQLNSNDLSLFIQQTTRVYESQLEFSYFMQDEGLFSSIGNLASFVGKIPTLLVHGKTFQGIALKAMDSLFKKVHLILLRSIEKSEDKMIHMDKIKNLLKSMEMTGYIPALMTAKTMGIFLSRLSETWLYAPGKKHPHINSKKLSYFRLVFKAWGERQSFLNQAFLNAESISLDDLDRVAGQNKRLKKWLSVPRKMNLHQWTADHRVVFSKDTSDLSYEEMTVSNSFYTMIAIFSKPYLKEGHDMFDMALKKRNIQDIYEVMRILGVEMGFVDSRVHDTGYRIFDEANHFTTQKRPNKVVDVYEGHEILSVLFNAGGLSTQVYNSFPEDCFLDYKGVLGHKVIEVGCFRKHLAQNFDKFFSQLPSVSQFWNNIGQDKEEEVCIQHGKCHIMKIPAEIGVEEGRKKMIGVLEVASRGGSIDEKPVDMGEIRVMVSILYYLESVFYNFDENKNGIATGDEILNAEKQFRDLVVDFISKAEKAKADSVSEKDKSLEDNASFSEKKESLENLAPAVFTYILKNGSIPKTETRTEKLAFAAWYYSYRNWAKSAEVDAGHVMRVFSALGKASNQGKHGEIAKFIKDNRRRLLDALGVEKAPDCRDHKKSIFCRWSRLINCNENIDSDLFERMKNTQLAFFPDSEWRSDEELAIQNSIQRLSEMMRADKQFSTRCSFPAMPNELSLEESLKQLKEDEDPKSKEEKDESIWSKFFN